MLATDDHRWGLWLAYTQQSQWQLYSADISRPFRETNYEAGSLRQLSSRRRTRQLATGTCSISATLTSRTDGRPDLAQLGPAVRRARLERDNFVLLARAWTRIPGDYEDDNPDIVDYYGHGEITGVYKWRDNSFSLMARGNLDTGKGAAQFTWAHGRCSDRYAATCRCSPATAKA